MPNYDYLCENCGHTFEQFQSITAKNLSKCPQCTKRKLKRLIGAGSAVIFKGSGFYQTDYRTDSYKKGAKSAKKSASTGTSKKETAAKTPTAKSSPKTESSTSGKKTDARSA